MQRSSTNQSQKTDQPRADAIRRRAGERLMESLRASADQPRADAIAALATELCPDDEPCSGHIQRAIEFEKWFSRNETTTATLAPADPTADPVEHRPVALVSGDRRWVGCVCGHPADPTADLLLQWSRKAKNASGDDFHDGLRAAFNECIRDLRADLAKSQPATGTDPSWVGRMGNVDD